MTAADYTEVLRAARRLTLSERLRLASVLVNEAAGEIPPSPEQRTMTAEEALTVLDEVRTHFAAQGPVSPTIADDLTEARR